MLNFPAYYSDLFSFQIPHHYDVREIVIEALESLKWRVYETSEDMIAAAVRCNNWSWGEKVTVKILGENRVSITSRCAMQTQLIDWGKNKANVTMLIAELQKVVALRVLKEPVSYVKPEARYKSNPDSDSEKIQQNENRIR